MTEEEKERYAAGFAVHVGVDTGKTFHKLVARRPSDVRSKPFKVTVDRAGFDAAHAHLRELFRTSPRIGCSSASSSPATTASPSSTT
jgi:hypothetical protein